MDKLIQYKYSYYLLSFYLLAILLTMATANKIIQIGDFIVPGGIFIFPLTFLVNDIASEVYGYTYPRMFIWLGLICEFVFSLYGISVSNLSSPDYFKYTSDYIHVFDPTFRFFFASLIGVFVGEFINIMLMTSLKRKIKKNAYVFRSIVSTFVGQLMLSMIVDLAAFFGKTNNVYGLIKLMIFGFVVKMTIAIVFVVPSWMITKKLKSIEGIKKVDITASYNPFSLKLT